MEEKEFWYIFARNPVIAMERVFAENVRLKKEINYACTDCANLQALDAKLDKYRQVLQEIKEIASASYKPFDYSQIKSPTEVEYDYISRGQECYLRLGKILQKIYEVNNE